MRSRIGIGRRLPSKRNLRHMNQSTRHIGEPVWRTLRPFEIARARPRLRGYNTLQFRLLGVRVAYDVVVG